VQVLLNNLIYDLSQLGIPFDRADPDEAARPRGWDLKGLIRSAAIMGPLSSIFDILTFSCLIFWFHVGTAGFRAAWFIESIATQILVVFIIRTTRPAWFDRPHPALAATSILGLATAIGLVLGPVGESLGFAVPAAGVLAVIVGLVACYLLSAEVFKRWALRDTNPISDRLRAASSPLTATSVTDASAAPSCSGNVYPEKLGQ